MCCREPTLSCSSVLSLAFRSFGSFSSRVQQRRILKYIYSRFCVSLTLFHSRFSFSSRSLSYLFFRLFGKSERDIEGVRDGDGRGRLGERAERERDRDIMGL